MEIAFTSSQFRQISRKAADSISKIERGTLLTHDILEEMYGITRIENAHKYYDFVRKTRDLLMFEHGMFLRNYRDVGYYVCERGKEIDACTNMHQNGKKRMIQATINTSYIRIDEIANMKDLERTVYEIQKMSNLNGLLCAGQAEISAKKLTS